MSTAYMSAAHLPNGKTKSGLLRFGRNATDFLLVLSVAFFGFVPDAHAAGVTTFHIAAHKVACRDVPTSFVFNTMLNPPDPDRSYTLTFDDGRGPRTLTPPAQGAFVLSVTYTALGQYTWEGRATDSEGGASSELKSGIINVTDCGPEDAPVSVRKLRDDIGNSSGCNEPAQIEVTVEPNPVKYTTLTVDWGDGSPTKSAKIPPSTVALTVPFEHCYPIAGFFTDGQLVWDWMAFAFIEQEPTKQPATVGISHVC